MTGVREFSKSPPTTGTTCTTAPSGMMATNTIQIPTDATRTTQSRSSSAILAKKTAKDFVFEQVIGEGSFSMVCLARETETQREVAIKICEKKHIRRYQKQKQIMREKELMNLLNQHRSPYFIKLYCTFQDTDRLFFVMTYAPNGELLRYIKQVGSFDEDCTRFYGGEILLALEHLHKVGIIHRDLKPENILLKEDMHIMITDFGSACLIEPSVTSPLPSVAIEDSSMSDSSLHPPPGGNSHDPGKGPGKSTSQEKPRRASFDGTPQYVSPEMLTEKRATPASDLWAFGCIVYQMVAGLPPFHAPNEYQIFQKITRLEYQFPAGFNEHAQDLVQQLLIVKYADRLGSQDNLHQDGYVSIKSHPFFCSLSSRWEKLYSETPPRIVPNLPNAPAETDLHLRTDPCVPKKLEPGLDEKQMTRLLGLALNDEDVADSAPFPFPSSSSSITTSTITSNKKSRNPFALQCPIN